MTERWTGEAAQIKQLPDLCPGKKSQDWAWVGVKPISGATLDPRTSTCLSSTGKRIEYSTASLLNAVVDWLKQYADADKSRSS